MKKIVSFSLILATALTFALTSCSDVDDLTKDTKRHVMDYNRVVKKGTAIDRFEPDLGSEVTFNTNGDILQKKNLETGVIVESYIYDNLHQGKLKEYLTYDPDTSANLTFLQYTYDNDGNLIKEEDNLNNTRWEYEYNYVWNNKKYLSKKKHIGPIYTLNSISYEYNKDKLVKETEYDLANIRQYYIVYEYDDHGNNIKQTKYDDDHAFIQQIKYEYNNKDLCVREEKWYDENTMTFYFTYEYNINGLLTCEAFYNSSGVLGEKVVTKYNANGLPILEESWEDNGSGLLLQNYVKGKYNSKGDQICEEYFVVYNGNIAYVSQAYDITWEYYN